MEIPEARITVGRGCITCRNAETSDGTFATWKETREDRRKWRAHDEYSRSGSCVEKAVSVVWQGGNWN